MKLKNKKTATDNFWWYEGFPEYKISERQILSALLDSKDYKDTYLPISQLTTKQELKLKRRLIKEWVERYHPEYMI